MSMNIKNNQCYCTVMYGKHKEVKPDPFCSDCAGTGITTRHESLYEKLLKETKEISYDCRQ